MDIVGILRKRGSPADISRAIVIVGIRKRECPADVSRAMVIVGIIRKRGIPG